MSYAGYKGGRKASATRRPMQFRWCSMLCDGDGKGRAGTPSVSVTSSERVEWVAVTCHAGGVQAIVDAGIQVDGGSRVPVCAIASCPCRQGGCRGADDPVEHVAARAPAWPPPSVCGLGSPDR